jgi:outer membrane protein assembly factor BamB
LAIDHQPNPIAPGGPAGLIFAAMNYTRPCAGLFRKLFLPASLQAIVGAVVLLLPMAAAHAANWPAWRGPAGNGISPEKNLPQRWSTNENVRWRAPLPGPGNSTPIVWGKRVFVTQAVPKENRRTVMCLDARDGKLLWQSGTEWTEKESGGGANPPCTPSPVCDGQRVIAWFGSAGVFCFDLSGRELWRRDLGKQAHGWGYASSPVLHGNLCLLNFGPGVRSFLIALDKKTGKTVWQYDVPPLSADAKWEDFGGDLNEWKKMGSPTMPEVSGSCATPLVVRAGGRDEVVVPYPLRVMAFAARDGKLLWTCGGLNTGAYGSAFAGDGLVAVLGSGLRNSALAVLPGGSGDVTESRRRWHVVPGNSKSCIGTGVIFQGRIYAATMMGFVQCLDLQTGKTIWDERLPGTGAKKSSWSSPLLAGDRLYVPNQNAEVFVLRAGDKYECLATNSLGGEPMNASLAAANGAIFIRTDRNLWCIGATQ